MLPLTKRFVTKRFVNGAIRLSLGVILLEAAFLTGCASESLFDKLPQSMGGLPSDAPARPATTPAYPAVHDMPPPRANQTLSDDERQSLEKDLRALRERTRRQNPDAGQAVNNPNKTNKKAATAKKPDAADESQSAGARRNP